MSVHHPVFARLYAFLSKRMDEVAEPFRTEMLAGLSGRVMEVGCGNGLNFHRYPAEVTEVVAVEPESYLRDRAVEAARSASVPVSVVEGEAGSLPAGDGEFDAVVSSLVLCSVPDQAAALAQMRRVLRPGGELRVFEHVIAKGGRLRTWQNRLARPWRKVNGGCSPNRDTGAEIEAAGFDPSGLRRGRVPRAGLTAPCLVGIARLTG